MTLRASICPIYNSTLRTLKEKLKEYREELHCEYSGLPSVMSYATKKEEKKENEEFLIGHS